MPLANRLRESLSCAVGDDDRLGVVINDGGSSSDGAEVQPFAFLLDRVAVFSEVGIDGLVKAVEVASEDFRVRRQCFFSLLWRFETRDRDGGLPGGDGIHATRNLMIHRAENVDVPPFRAALAIATPCCLDDRIEWSERPPNGWEIDIHPGFDELGGDYPTGMAIPQEPAHETDDPQAVGGAHRG